MNKEIVIDVINEVVGERLTQLIEEMSTNEFIEMVTDIIQDRMGVTIDEHEELEEIRNIIGSRILPLLLKVCEWSVGKNIPTE